MNSKKLIIYGFWSRPEIRINILVIVFYSLTFLQIKAQDHVFSKDSLGSEASHLLSDYIQHSSVTGNEKAAGEFLLGLCREKGLNVKVLIDSLDSYNFAASLYPLDMNKPNIILLHHIDVVTEGDTSGWKFPPFSGAIIQDTVWGRGTIDMKCVAIMHLLAVSSFIGKAGESDLPMNVTLLCVSGEESYGISGAKLVSDNCLKELNPVVVLGEGGIGTKNVLPSSPDRLVFCISISDKRALWIKLRLKYETSGHGAIPPPEYANKMMINALSSLADIRPKIHFNPDTKTMFNAFGKMNKGLTGFVIKSPVLFKPLIAGKLRKEPLLLSTVTNSLTITRFDGQTNDINQIPQEISVMLDCRLLHETSTQDFLDYLRKKINNSRIEISIVLETQNAPPSLPDKYYGLFEKSILETYPGAGVLPILFPATTDNNFFRYRGVPTYGLEPIFIDDKLFKTIHNYNERIPVEALVQGTEVYRRVLEELLLKGY